MKLQINKNNFFKKLLLAIGFFLIPLVSSVIPHRVSAATLYSQAANQDVYEGQNFVVDWYLDSEGQSINAINLGLTFSKDTLQVSEASPGNSLINLWIQTPTSDNKKGKINLVGGISNGTSGTKIPIFRTVFEAKTPGSSFINLDPSSQILLNDGRGTSTLLKFKNEAFNVYPKNFIPIEISSPTHPDQNAWYKNRDVAIKFTPQTGTDYSYSFSSNTEIIPEDRALSVPPEIPYKNLLDGIYYFKLNSKVGSGNWQEAGVYRVQIDSTPPEAFTPQVGSDPNVSGGQNFLSFSTVDKTSGISHYKIKLGAFRTANFASSPYILPKLIFGKTIQVTAFDNAGNQNTQNINYDPGVSLWIIWLTLGLLLLILLFAIPKTRKIVTNKFKTN